MSHITKIRGEKFPLENRRGLRAFRTDNLPKRSVGCPGLKLVSVLGVVVAAHGHRGVKNPIQQYKTVRPCLTL